MGNKDITQSVWATKWENTVGEPRKDIFKQERGNLKNSGGNKKNGD